MNLSKICEVFRKAQITDVPVEHSLKILETPECRGYSEHIQMEVELPLRSPAKFQQQLLGTMDSK